MAREENFMRLIKIGMANGDPTVGALESNTDRMIAQARRMHEDECTLGCFPEQAISGYPVEDLVLWNHFLSGQATQIDRFLRTTAEMETVFVFGAAVQVDSNAYNVAIVAAEGRMLGIVPKEKLPTYGVFYEKRTYSAGFAGFEAQWKGIPFGDFIFSFPCGLGKVAVEVCEDIWSPDGPMRRRAYSGAELVINLSASPFRAGIYQTRQEMIATRASDNSATVVYVNQFGANGALVFDGGGFVNQCGRMLHEASRWQDGYSCAMIDLDRASRQRRENSTWRADRENFLRGTQPVREIISQVKAPVNSPSYAYPFPATRNFFLPPDTTQPSLREQFFDDLTEAFTVGIEGYYRKTKAFRCLGVALSGGKDSVLVLLLAYLAATRRMKVPTGELETFIQSFSMPTRFNSDLTKGIARNIARELGVGFKELSIAEEYAEAIENTEAMLNPSEKVTRIGLQNIQARIRAKRMWDWANATGGMWLQTGNMSEKAVGYMTIGADLMGALSVLANLPKTVIIVYIEHLNRTTFHSETLTQLLESTASAELAEGQEDEKELMPFPVLDACYALFAAEKMAPQEVLEVVGQMFPEYSPDLVNGWVNKFVILFRQSIFKWVQSPEAIHVGSLDLDRERALQLPVVQSSEWLDEQC